ncbi:leucine-rich repeat domain-containing protein [Aquimarina sp. 2201CG14-23]|uniref:leucine-rich repeat domain-containing protein n=1 Tax=Aquimarina mycalae TaxID=3040073 RepID=UPI002477DBA8|nr:COR domain-containing protein [Aquimarina sp. 2201CG14-23]MDH7447246.1 COR domain-containing protein [Aquimarina sp. 2201CG14-23]
MSDSKIIKEIEQRLSKIPVFRLYDNDDDLFLPNGYSMDNNNKVNKLSIQLERGIEGPENIGLSKETLLLICELVNLEVLDLAHNYIPYLPKEIGNLKNLKELFLGGNSLTSLPSEIRKLTRLKKLSLNSNQFEVLPLEITSLINLEQLSINSNGIKYLPVEIGNLTKLNKLEINKNRLQDLSSEVGNLQKIHTLDLSANYLRTLPRTINKLNRIIDLSIGANLLENFPLEIGSMQKLKVLNLSNNKLKNIPKEIEGLTHLEILHINNNHLEKISPKIKYLKALQKLFINSNQLEYLPSEIGELSNLKFLLLNSNQLTNLPSEIGMLSNLLKLDLDFNQIDQLPPEIGQLLSLKELSLNSNKLSNIPSEIGDLKGLMKLELKLNPNIVSPPLSVLEKGLTNIQKYLSTSQVKVWKGKVVIIGEGGVGKSCLLDAIEEKPFNSNNPTTHGINIRKIEASLNVENKMELNFWDFGGQDIYHATHQFYLSNHSLFILVWNARQGFEAGKVEKWLETIEALAPESPILVVATNTKERGADLPKDEFKQRFINIKSFINIDNENNYGISLLKEKIKNEALQIPYMGVDRPQTWIKSMESLSLMEEKYITKRELFSIFKRNEVYKENYESFANYLHALGEILYYPEDEELCNTIILKPKWVSEHIARVLDNETITKNAGFLNKTLMQNLWHDLDSDTQVKFLSLMEKFDLSYRTDERGVCLVVEKLKHEEDLRYVEPWENKKETKEIHFIYQLSVIPAGVPTWFIARTHRYSKFIHWKNGAFLEDNQSDSLCLIIASEFNREIHLKVRGSNPYSFFYKLRDIFEHTLSRFKGLSVKIYVPCRGNGVDLCEHNFRLELLKKRLEKKPPITNIECPVEIEIKSVTELLFGISDTSVPDVLAKIKENTESILQNSNQKNENLKNELLDLKEYIQLQFIHQNQSIQKLLDISCPNIFTFKPKNILDWGNVDISQHVFELTLYCQMPGKMHPVVTYEITENRDWVNSILPYYNKMLRLVRIAVPFVFEGASGLLTIKHDGVLKKLTTITKPLKPIPIEDNIVEPDLIYTSKTFSNHNDGNTIRLLKETLKKADPSCNWGGLSRKVTSEGKVLWLCKEHYNEI